MNQEAAPLAVAESASPKEVLADERAVALHTRLLLGKDALDPDKTDLPEVDAQKLASQHQETRDDTLNKMSAASTVDRWEYWQKKGGAFDEQMQNWIAEIIQSYKNPSTNATTLSATLTRLNLGEGNDRINLANLDETNAIKLFQRYFAENSYQVTIKAENGDFVTIPSHVKRFIDDVAASYQGNYEQLQADLPSIQWIAAMFGDISDELVAQLINAEAKLQNEAKKQELVQNANTDDRRNKVNSEERRLLEHLKVKAAKVTSYAGPEPTTPPPTTPPKPKPGGPEGPEPNILIRKPPPPEPTFVTEEKPKLFYRHLRKTADHLREFPTSDTPTVEEHAKLIALNEHRERVGNWSKTEAQMTPEEKTEFQQRANDLVAQINKEYEEINQYRSNIHLDDNTLKSMFNELTGDMRSFMKKTYNVDLPQSIDPLKVFILSPTLAQYYNPRQVAIAFFDPEKPIVYIDWERIRSDAKNIGKTINAVTFDEFRNLFKTHVNKTSAHELNHFYGEISYWYLLETDKKEFEKLTEEEIKKAEILPGRTGLEFLKPRLTSEGKLIRYPDHTLAWKERGRYLTEAVTERLAQEYMKTVDPSYNFGTYPAEIKVLNAIMQHTDVPFSAFVKSYFGRHELLDLAEKLSGKRKDEKGIHFDRPHYLEIATALMEYDAAMARQHNTRTDFRLTLSYLDDTLDAAQKQELKNLLENTPDYIQLPQSTKEYMASKLGITLEKPRPVVTELPITLEMAQNGVADFEKVVRKLPADVAKLFLNDPYFAACFVGSEPTVGEYNNTALDQMNNDQLNNLRTVMESETKGLEVIDHGKTHLFSKPLRSLMNLEAAARVIIQNKDQFPPEAAQNPKEWLTAHPSEWFHLHPKVNKADKDKIEIRFGLLTGLPPDAVKKYRPYINARQKFEKIVFPTLNKDELTFFVQYQKTDSLPYCDENQKKLEALLDKAGNNLTAQEKDLILERRNRPRSKGVERFSAFTDQDLQYADKLEQLYAQSGMEETIARLKAELKL